MAATAVCNATRSNSGEHLRQSQAGVRPQLHQTFGGGGTHYAATAITAFGAQIYHPIGFSDDIQIMLNDDNTVTPIDPNGAAHG
jgi:hypothetical protein